MFKWYSVAKRILEKEPEVWLSYLQGQQLDKIPHLAERKSRHSGFLLQFIKHPYSIVRTLDLVPQNSNKSTNKCDYYVFAGTNNQLSSLSSTIDALKIKDQKVIAITSESLASDTRWKDYQALKLSHNDVIKSIFLMLIRTPKLYTDLKNLHPNALKYWYSEFCSVYSYLAYFERTLTETQASCVITSNDHSIPNRCLLAAAHELGIKTAYLQHASVSNIFPALRVNYAFLDGESALDTYKQCEANQPGTNRDIPKPKVFLTGQKKPINKVNSNKSLPAQNIGFAINMLDNIKDVLELSDQLLTLNKQIIIRWHPRQSKSDIDRLKNHFYEVENISFSDPYLETVDQCFARTSWLVSGNSSIHLEAALAGVLPIYYEISPTNSPDYYGYVKSGLAVKADDFDEIKNIIEQKLLSNKARDLAIRYYSSTYNTPWEGNEGTLVAECLIALKEGRSTPIQPLNL